MQDEETDSKVSLGLSKLADAKDMRTVAISTWIYIIGLAMHWTLKMENDAKRIFLDAKYKAFIKKLWWAAFLDFGEHLIAKRGLEVLQESIKKPLENTASGNKLSFFKFEMHIHVLQGVYKFFKIFKNMMETRSFCH